MTEEQKEKRRARQRNLSEEQKEKRREYDRNYKRNLRDNLSEEQKEKKRENRREWRDKSKEKVREFQKKWRDKSKEKIREYNKRWYEKNKKKMKEYNKKWYENNKKHIKIDTAKRSKRLKLRREINPLFKLSSNIRSSLSRAMARNGHVKKSKTTDILGIDFVSFKQHLESQFEPWMNWDNYGKYMVDTFNYGWDIDHIIPCSSATTEEEIIKLNHYTNLRPLCSKINRDVKRDTHHT